MATFVLLKMDSFVSVYHVSLILKYLEMYDLCHCKNKGLELRNFGNPFEVDLCEYNIATVLIQLAFQIRSEKNMHFLRC
jgi:hypothetical protein